MSDFSESEEVSSSEESSDNENGMDLDRIEELSNHSGSSQQVDLQERDNIFNITPGQAALLTQDWHMKDSTNSGASMGGLGQDGSKPGGETIGGPGAVQGGKKKKTSGSCTSGRERKETVRFDPNNSSTF
jgi:hypothetical protein